MTNTTSPIKEALIKANRYDDVMKILNYFMNIQILNDGQYPIAPVIIQNKNGKNETLLRVKGYDLKIQAFAVKVLIENAKCIAEIMNYDRDLNMLNIYVSSRIDTDLHNYANEIVHDRKPADAELDKIRAWMVLKDIINYIMYLEDYIEDGGYDDCINDAILEIDKCLYGPCKCENTITKLPEN